MFTATTRKGHPVFWMALPQRCSLTHRSWCCWVSNEDSAEPLYLFIILKADNNRLMLFDPFCIMPLPNGYCSVFPCVEVFLPGKGYRLGAALLIGIKILCSGWMDEILNALKPCIVCLLTCQFPSGPAAIGRAGHRHIRINIGIAVHNQSWTFCVWSVGSFCHRICREAYRRHRAGNDSRNNDPKRRFLFCNSTHFSPSFFRQLLQRPADRL